MSMTEQVCKSFMISYSYIGGFEFNYSKGKTEILEKS